MPAIRVALFVSHFIMSKAHNFMYSFPPKTVFQSFVDIALCLMWASGL